MNMKTKLELAVRVLRDLSVIDATEDVDETNDDVAWVIEQYEDKYEELAAPGFELAYWARDEIPQAIFTTISDLVRNEVQGSFGAPMAASDKLAQEEIILRKLRRHTSIDKSGLPVKAEYF